MNQFYHLLLAIVLVFNMGGFAPAGQTGGLGVEPAGFSVYYHPDGGLIAGDQVSLEIFTDSTFREQGAKISVRLVSPVESTLGEASFAPDALGGQVATLLWIWDTSHLSPGDYLLQFTLTPGDQTWQETVHLGAPPPGPAPVWLERDTACCRLHYIYGSAAERDINALAQLVEERAHLAASLLGYDLAKGDNLAKEGGKLDIDLIPRVLGQGGFTSDEVIVTYSDENYVRSDIGVILQHELTHRIDALLGGDFKPLILMEGLAVYLTGGHYKIEPVLLEAAFLIRGGDYLPLNILANDFYSHQHESGYLEAAALVGYLISTWGYDGFNQFYRDIHQVKGGTDADAIDTALKKHIGLSLQQLDDRMVGWLAAQPVLPDMNQDLQVMADYFDLMRTFQAKFDPSADFHQTWLPDPREMRKRGIVADYLRGPNTKVDQEITGLFTDAGQNWRMGQYSQAWMDLGEVRQVIRNNP
jgi:hypothetical protein